MAFEAALRQIKNQASGVRQQAKASGMVINIAVMIESAD
jgi:hypothetical protein